MQTVRRLWLGGFTVLWLFVWVRLWWTALPLAENRWPATALSLVALGATLTWLASDLPWPNVVAAAAVVLLVYFAAEALLAQLAGLFPAPATRAAWLDGLLAMTLIFNCWGAAVFLLKPKRDSNVYGLWVLGLSSLLCGLSGFALVGSEPTQGRGPGQLCLNLVAWVLVSAAALVVATPWLINKRPAASAPTYQPLLVWLLFTILFMTAIGLRRPW